MTDAPPVCCHCQRIFKNDRGLTQHLNTNKLCKAKEDASNGVDFGYETAQEFTAFYPVINQVTWAKSVARLIDLEARKSQSGATTDKSFAKTLNSDHVAAVDEKIEAYQTALEDMTDADDNDMTGLGDDSSEDDATDDNNSAAPEERAYNQEIRNNFRKYCEEAHHLDGISKEEEDALNLLRILRKSKASLTMYEQIMEWHLKSKGVLHEWEKVSGTSHFLSRRKLFDKLARRYNKQDGYNMKMELVLPYSKAKVNVIYNDLQKVIQSLLTDPRIMANDYLFNDKDNIFAPPPTESKYIGDINTGNAYRKTYERLITNPQKQILLPIIPYQDGCATGQFTDLKVTAFQITLGIFNRNARDKRFCWRTIGYLPSFVEEKSRGKRQLVDSNHVEGHRQRAVIDDDEGQNDVENVVKAQDLHALMKALMEQLVELQDKGFVWDLYYNGRIYKDVEFIPFIPFLMCDTEEADRHCGRYLARSQGVKNLCRYCYCPTLQCSNPKANYPLKEWKDIDNMVQSEDYEQLQGISQQFIDNAWYYVQFGFHNNQGVHGACPMEILHHVLLGIFSMTSKCFWLQLGKDSKLAREFDALCTEFGSQYQRQSDRGLPKTHFSKGIRNCTKLMAQEHTGVLLLMLTALLSGKGTEIVCKRKYFRLHGHLADWIMLLETLLEWESWLNLGEMKVKHVQKYGEKSRRLMYLIKKVCKREVGMGLNTVKFHGISHMQQDIRNFGVPSNYNTKAKEAHHKPTKTSAMLTQKRKELFDEQLAKREFEIDLLELAQEELDGRPLFQYYEGYDYAEKKQPNREVSVGGRAYFCEWSDAVDRYVLSTVMPIRGNDTKIRAEAPLTQFFGGLQEAVQDLIGSITLLSEHVRNGSIFRGSLSYRSEIWRDWIVIDWDDWGHLPNKVWGFVDLRSLPHNSGVSYGGLDNLLPAIYAVVENSEIVQYDDNDYSPLARSELFQVIRMEVSAMHNNQSIKNKFYLADVDAIVSPAVVVPNIGGPINEYLWLAERSEWHRLFTEWLDSPLQDDHYATDVETEGEGSETSDEE